MQFVFRLKLFLLRSLIFYCNDWPPSYGWDSTRRRYRTSHSDRKHVRWTQPTKLRQNFIVETRLRRLNEKYRLKKGPMFHNMLPPALLSDTFWTYFPFNFMVIRHIACCSMLQKLSGLKVIHSNVKVNTNQVLRTCCCCYHSTRWCCSYNRRCSQSYFYIEI